MTLDSNIQGPDANSLRTNDRATPAWTSWVDDAEEHDLGEVPVEHAEIFGGSEGSLGMVSARLEELVRPVESMCARLAVHIDDEHNESERARCPRGAGSTSPRRRTLSLCTCVAWRRSGAGCVRRRGWRDLDGRPFRAPTCPPVATSRLSWVAKAGKGLWEFDARTVAAGLVEGSRREGVDSWREDCQRRRPDFGSQQPRMSRYLDLMARAWVSAVRQSFDADRHEAVAVEKASV
jgi:hypothetical protein